MPLDQLTAEPTELLRTMIRNACVNDDTIGSGQEIRNVQALEDYFAGSGLSCRRFEAAPGRASLVARIEGRDPPRRRSSSWGTPTSSRPTPRAGAGIRSAGSSSTTSSGAAAPRTC